METLPTEDQWNVQHEANMKDLAITTVVSLLAHQQHNPPLERMDAQTLVAEAGIVLAWLKQ